MTQFAQDSSTDAWKLEMAEVQAAVGELNSRDHQYSQGILLAEEFGDEEEDWEDLDFTQLDADSKLRTKAQWFGSKIVHRISRAASAAMRYAKKAASKAYHYAREKASRLKKIAVAAAKRGLANARKYAKAAASATIKAAIAAAKAAKAAAMVMYKLGKMLLKWKNFVTFMMVVIKCVKSQIPTLGNMMKLIKSLGLLKGLPLMIKCFGHFKNMHGCYKYYKKGKKLGPKCLSKVKSAIKNMARATAKTMGLAQLSVQDQNKLILAQVRVVMKDNNSKTSLAQLKARLGVGNHITKDQVRLVRGHVDCRGSDHWMGRYNNVTDCCNKTLAKGYAYCAYGIGKRRRKCYGYKKKACRRVKRYWEYSIYKVVTPPLPSLYPSRAKIA